MKLPVTKKGLTKSFLIIAGIITLLIGMSLFISVLFPTPRANEQYGSCSTRALGKRTYYVALSAGSPLRNVFEKMDADYKTLETIQRGYCKDAMFVYYWGMIIPDADPETFSVKTTSSESLWSFDKNNVFFRGEKTLLDPNTLELYRCPDAYTYYYAKDVTHYVTTSEKSMNEPIQEVSKDKWEKEITSNSACIRIDSI